MKTLQQTILILSTVALLSTVAVAQPGPGRMHRGQGNGDCDGRPGPEMRLERMKQHLELTEAQVAAIQEIQDQARAETREVRKEIARLRNQKQGEMLKDEPSAKVLTGIIEKMGELRTKLQVNRMETRLAVREQLTEEQRDQMMMLGRRHGRGGRGMGDDCSPRGGRGQRQGRGW